jgi:hypothetical protein
MTICGVFTPRGGEGRVASWRTVSSRRVHRDQHDPAGRAGGGVLQPARLGGAAHQGRQERGHLDPAVQPSLRRQRGAAATARVGLQPRQLPADPGAAGRGEALVTHDPARPPGEDRRQDRPARPVDNVPDGRGRGAARCSRTSWPLSRHSVHPCRRPDVECRCRSWPRRLLAQENCVRISSDVSGFLVSRRSRANRGGRMRQAGANDVAGRPEGRLPCLTDSQMGWPSGECRIAPLPWG